MLQTKRKTTNYYRKLLDLSKAHFNLFCGLIHNPDFLSLSLFFPPKDLALGIILLTAVSFKTFPALKAVE